MDEEKLFFRKAVSTDADDIYALYQSVKGSEFCVWNAEYPGWIEVREDLRTGSLYVLTEADRIIGAISVVPENEMDAFSCWKCLDGTQREIARVAVDRKCRGRGLSGEMIGKTEVILRQNGCHAIHLAVVKGHAPAYRTYLKAGFITVGEADMYGNRYYLMEKMLKRDS